MVLVVVSAFVVVHRPFQPRRIVESFCASRPWSPVLVCIPVPPRDQQLRQSRDLSGVETGTGPCIQCMVCRRLSNGDMMVWFRRTFSHWQLVSPSSGSGGGASKPQTFTFRWRQRKQPLLKCPGNTIVPSSKQTQSRKRAIWNRCNAERWRRWENIGPSTNLGERPSLRRQHRRVHNWPKASASLKWHLTQRGLACDACRGCIRSRIPARWSTLADLSGGLPRGIFDIGATPESHSTVYSSNREEG